MWSRTINLVPGLQVQCVPTHRGCTLLYDNASHRYSIPVHTYIIHGLCVLVHLYTIAVIVHDRSTIHTVLHTQLYSINGSTCVQTIYYKRCSPHYNYTLMVAVLMYNWITFIQLYITSGSTWHNTWYSCYCVYNESTSDCPWWCWEGHLGRERGQQYWCSTSALYSQHWHDQSASL